MRPTLRFWNGETGMNVKIRSLSREDSEFYILLGPYFGSRLVAKEVGINIYDDVDKKWFCAFDDEKLIGFASLRGRTVSDCYVVKSRRRLGIFSEILSSLVQSSSAELLATCTKASIGVFLSIGFEEKSQTKNFTKVELKCRRKV